MDIVKGDLRLNNTLVRLTVIVADGLTIVHVYSVPHRKKKKSFRHLQAKTSYLISINFSREDFKKMPPI
jgi:hypothetical protein